MIRYLMTSARIEGEVEFTFGDDGALINMVFPPNFTQKQYEFTFKYKPYCIELMEAFIAITKDVTFTKEVKPLSFDDFWNKYGEKEHSSKKKTEIKWNNMPKSARIKAFNYINRYKMSLPQGVRMKYAETYLNSELWEN